jgi:hypothetical protein
VRDEQSCECSDLMRAGSGPESISQFRRLRQIDELLSHSIGVVGAELSVYVESQHSSSFRHGTWGCVSCVCRSDQGVCGGDQHAERVSSLKDIGQPVSLNLSRFVPSRRQLAEIAVTCFDVVRLCGVWVIESRYVAVRDVVE